MSIQRIGAALLIAGVIFTLWDYKNWRREETRLYGLGKPVEVGYSPAADLGETFTNSVAGVRIKYPKDWKIRSNPELEKEGAHLSGNKIEVLEMSSGGVTVTVSVQEVKQDLPVIADKMAAGIVKERDYITSATAAWTILTWSDKQIALAKKDNRLYVVEATFEKSAWKQFSKTFEEIYRQAVLI